MKTNGVATEPPPAGTGGFLLNLDRSPPLPPSLNSRLSSRG